MLLLSDGFRRKLFTGFKSDGLAGRDRDLFASSRIAADTALARFDDENTEAAQLDAITVGKCILHRLKQRVYDLLGLLLWDTSPVGDQIDYI